MIADASKILPHTQVIIGTGDAIERENLVEFRLLYQGILLPSAGTNKRSAEKHEIRRQFHPQLRRLWNVKPNLRYLAESFSNKMPESFERDTFADKSLFEIGLQVIGKNWNRCGYDFVPLVTEALALRCSLDILLLRPGDKQYILEQGDVDGQIKTLFDALRMPQDMESVGGSGPSENEKPFFCLLEDDRLISEVRVTSDELLLLPHEREVKANDAFVVIHVRLNHKDARTWDNYFG